MGRVHGEAKPRTDAHLEHAFTRIYFQVTDDGLARSLEDPAEYAIVNYRVIRIDAFYLFGIDRHQVRFRCLSWGL